jgi:hypothetical protein
VAVEVELDAVAVGEGLGGDGFDFFGRGELADALEDFAEVGEFDGELFFVSGVLELAAAAFGVDAAVGGGAVL